MSRFITELVFVLKSVELRCLCSFPCTLLPLLFGDIFMTNSGKESKAKHSLRNCSPK